MTFADALAQAYALGQSWLEHSSAGRDDAALDVSERFRLLRERFETPAVHWVSGPGDD